MANHKIKVIVADDVEVIADTLVIILKQAGFDARAAYSGEMAVEMAQSFQPDKLISDVFMTGITGIEAAIQVRTMLPSCQILLFSGQPPQTADLAQGEFDVLRKPIDHADLLARLRTGTYVDSHESKQNDCENRI
jgi:CheY-like chemotaxis protein